MALKPDLVLTFSDLQADIVAALLREGLTVMAYNQRDLAGIMAVIRQLGAMVGCSEQSEELAGSYERRLQDIRKNVSGRSRPRVYFEEWDDPMISGIHWVSELIEVAGGGDVFRTLASKSKAKDRIVQSADVIAAMPDIIIASWCGKNVPSEKIMARSGWHVIPV